MIHFFGDAATKLFTLQTQHDLGASDIEVLLVGLQPGPLDWLRSIGVIPDLVTENDIFEEIEDAFFYLKGKLG
jgi:SulP family sulfate permease